jgi:hypothetical protein
MPIVSISKIQHRYGLGENLPQLSAAEFGWAIDQRRLYIGNGPTSEGAPSIGNTEILTQYSNLLEVAENSYTYKDIAAGFEAITGESISAPTTRSLQEKLDDFANVRDYGAVGNGLADDTEAINRALTDLFTRDARPSVRRVLYFPAGNYLVSDVVKIPPYATLQGEGKNCTYITATNSSAGCVARNADSKLQVGANVGSNSAIMPNYIAVNDLSFNAASLTIDVFFINSAKYMSFRRVGFLGGLGTAPSISGSQKSCVRIYSTAVNHSQNIIFDDCEFSGTNYASIIDDDIENVVFDRCHFKNLYAGFVIGEFVLGSGASVLGPIGLRLTNSLFDKIYNSALITFNDVKVTSAFNTYLDVGNQVITVPTYPAIIFNGDNCASICDFFARTDLESLTSPRISYNSNKSVVVDPTYGISVGKKSVEAGGVVTLNNNTTSVTATGITFTTTQKAQKINYIATRGTTVRNGTFEVNATATGLTYSDSYTENGADLGLVLSANTSGTTVSVRFTTTNTGTDVTLSYSVERNNT